jgi:hypothetical protein
VACDTIAGPRIYQPDGRHWRPRWCHKAGGSAPTEPPSAGHDQVAPRESQVLSASPAEASVKPEAHARTANSVVAWRRGNGTRSIYDHQKVRRLDRAA